MKAIPAEIEIKLAKLWPPKAPSLGLRNHALKDLYDSFCKFIEINPCFGFVHPFIAVIVLWEIRKIRNS
jgi:hypothetical protein